MLGKKSIESIYPSFISVSLLFVSIWLLPKLQLGITQDVINTVIGSYINFAAITMGFEGALLGILFSISDSPLVKNLFKSRSKLLLKKYFMACLISGIISLGLSTIMYFIYLIPEFIPNLKYWVASFWIMSVSCYLLCNFRIVLVCMDILFSKDAGEVKKIEKLAEEQSLKLREKHTR